MDVKLREIRKNYEIRTKLRALKLQEKYEQIRARCMELLPICNHRRELQAHISVNENYKPPCPADYSYLNIHHFTDANIPIRAKWNKVRKEPPLDPTTGRYLTETVWLNHNKLKSLNMMMLFLETRIESARDITWLDLSFNRVPRIEWDILQLNELQILYLHCNCLESLEEIARLSALENLKILTMYGNPIEASEDYRLKIIALIPRLRRLDFSPVTDKERYWAQRYTIMQIEDETPVTEQKKAVEDVEKAVEDVEKAEEKYEEVEETVEEEEDEDLENVEEEEAEEVFLEGENEEIEEESIEGKISHKKPSQAVFVRPRDSSWWKAREHVKAEELFWELKEEEENYTFNYFVS